jgi:hypothetical protein
MTTSIIPFVPQAGLPFQFSCVLDGQTFDCTVTWNLFEQRFFINLFSTDGTRVLSIARVGSPSGYDISLVAGYYTTKLVWRDPDNQFEVIDA